MWIINETKQNDLRLRSEIEIEGERGTFELNCGEGGGRGPSMAREGADILNFWTIIFY